MSFSTPPTVHPDSALAIACKAVPSSDISLPELSFFFADAANPNRAGLEQFVAQIYERSYGARVSHFHDVLVGCLGGPDGELQAVLGITRLGSKSAFLEQYLEMPVEQAIYGAGHHAGCRSQIVELGNLAAQVPGASRCIIRYMTRYLHIRGYCHVVFTATQALANSFAKLHYEPRTLAKADPKKLRSNPASWGSYYESNPQVMVGDVRAAYAALF